jgi:ABC-type dipeptide/oligopeptide/nickel transport system permease subunit
MTIGGIPEIAVGETGVEVGSLAPVAGLVKSPWRRAARRFVRQPAGIIGLTLILGYLVMAVGAPLLSPYNPDQSFASALLHPPSSKFLLGTDELGRDLLSRIIYGTRPALAVGAAAVAVGAVIGALSGFAAGYFRSRVGNLIMRFWDGVFAVPAVLIGMALAATYGPSNAVIGAAVGIAAAPALARISYGSTLAELERGYVEASRSLGFRELRIFFLHVVPNALSAVIVNLALTMSGAILLEAALAFLGVGPPPPAPTWGVMLSTSRTYLGQAWWYGVFPGIAITGLVLGLNLLADAARDALDPRTV